MVGEHPSAEHDDVLIPVMFGDGRTRRINYASIKYTHAPNLTITEVGPVKPRLLATAEHLRSEGRPFDDEKVAAAVSLINDLMLEAAEALATYGTGWPEPGEPLPSEEELVRRYRIMPVLLNEEEGIARVLSEHADGLENDGQAARLREALRAIAELTRRARTGAG